MTASRTLSSFLYRTVLCLAAGVPLLAAPAHASTAPKGKEPAAKEKTTKPESEKRQPKVEPPKDKSDKREAKQAKKDLAKARAAAEKACHQAEKSVHDAMKSATDAMRAAVMSFHDATDDDSSGLTDAQITAMASAVRSQINQSARACAAAMKATYAELLSTMTMLNAPASMLDKVDHAFEKRVVHMGETTDYANRKLEQLVARAIAAEDVDQD